LLPPPPLLLLLLLLLLTRPSATVKDLRRQVSEFKAEIIKLQDSLKTREAEGAEAQRKVHELEALTQMQVRFVDGSRRCAVFYCDIWHELSRAELL
jgi:hypothetical protein